MRFLREDEAMKAMSLFEGAPENRRITKSSLKNWLVIFFLLHKTLLIHQDSSIFYAVYIYHSVVDFD